MQQHNQSFSLKISPLADLRIMQLQIILARQLGKKISKKKVIDSAILALMERVGLILEGDGSNVK